MRPDLVVVGDEAVELGLELADRSRGGLLGQVLLQCLVEALDLPAGLGMVGPGVLECDAEREQLRLHGAAPVAVAGGEDRPVVRSNDWPGEPQSCGFVEGTRPRRAMDTARAIEATHSREWSSMTLRTSTARPSAQLHVGDVGLPALVGELGDEADQGRLGACGAGG